MVTGVASSLPAVNKMQINLMWMQSGNETPADSRTGDITEVYQQHNNTSTAMI